LKSLSPLTPPLYAAFFAIAGTEMQLNIITSQTVLFIGILYFVSRAIGKYAGVWLGAVSVKADRRVRNYLGLSMLPQTGVAIGLVLFMQTTPFYVGSPENIKFIFDQMVNVVLFAVLLNGLIGPPLSKYGIIKGADI